MAEGTIKKVTDKGFGFISTGQDKDLFFHADSVQGVSFSELLPAVTGKGVYLRPPAATDYSEWASLREQSREFLTPWEPVWPSDDLTRAAFRRRRG